MRNHNARDMKKLSTKATTTASIVTVNRMAYGKNQFHSSTNGWGEKLDDEIAETTQRPTSHFNDEMNWQPLPESMSNENYFISMGALLNENSDLNRMSSSLTATPLNNEYGGVNESPADTTTDDGIVLTASPPPPPPAPHRLIGWIIMRIFVRLQLLPAYPYRSAQQQLLAIKMTRKTTTRRLSCIDKNLMSLTHVERRP